MYKEGDRTRGPGVVFRPINRTPPFDKGERLLLGWAYGNIGVKIVLHVD